jgi:hypothetical protein
LALAFLDCSPTDMTLINDDQASELLRTNYEEKRMALEKAAHAWACSIPVGPDRTRAFEIYETVRTLNRN